MHRRRFCRTVATPTLSLIVAVIVVFIPAVETQNEDLIPYLCKKSKPKSDGNCETARRWFLHETKGCKKYGICKHQTSELDFKTGINYFTSKEECLENCTRGIVCPELPAPANGNVTSDDVMSWGATVTYTCNDGYSLDGAEKRTCMRTATWDGSAPTCQKQCSPPPKVKHGTVGPVHNYYNQGTTIFYTCEEGYSSQITERTCETGGEWSGPEPECEFQEHYCPEPVLIQHGDIYAPDRSVGGEITYSCDEGFILIGNSTRSCGTDAHWEGDAPMCWKLSLEYFTEDDTNLEKMDITNKSVSLPMGTRNVWVVTGSSHPDPLKDVIPVWFFNDEILIEMQHPHGVEQHESKLKFPRILESREQEGNYTIKIGLYSVSFLLVVGDEVVVPMLNAVKPILVVTPANDTAGIGGIAQFTCVFSGCPAPNVTWFHENNTLEHGGRVNYLLYTQSRITICHLTISNVSEEDTGKYKCVGGNDAGNSSSDLVDLKIMEETRLTKRSLVVDDSSSQSSAKRSLCQQTSGPESVTAIATVSRELRRIRSLRWLRNYRFRVDKIFKGNHLQQTSSNKRSVRVVIADANDETTTTHLQADTKYILNGRMVDNVLYISGPQYIHHYSRELETHIQSC